MYVSLLSWLDSTFYDGLPYAIVTLSFVLTFKYIRFPDVTCAGTFVLGGAASAAATVFWGAPPIVAMLLALLAGALGGILTTFFYIGLHIDRLLSGILSAFTLYAVNLMILKPTLPYGTAATILTGAAKIDRAVEFYSFAWHPCAIAVMFLIVLIVKIILDFALGSEFGLALRALEDEEAGALYLQSLGLSPAYFQAFALILGNSIIGLSGAIISIKEGAANVHRGFDILVTGLIAFLLGVQLQQWIPNIIDKFRRYKLVGSLSFLRALIMRVQVTTLAIIGALLYFGLIAFSHRTAIPTEFAKLFLALFVAATVGNYDLLMRRIELMRLRRSVAAVGSIDEDLLITATDVSFSYPQSTRRVLDRLSFHLHSDECVILRGPNGSGKSTLVKLLAGHLDAPEDGKIIINGVDLTYEPRRRRQACAYAAQDQRSALIQSLSPTENLALARSGDQVSLLRRAITPETNQHIKSLLAEFTPDTLMQERPSCLLSGGQRQLLVFLTVLIRRDLPGVLFMDEPFNNLDQNNLQHCLSAIKSLRHRGVSIVLINHLARIDLPIDRSYDFGEFLSDGGSRGDRGIYSETKP